MRVTLGAPGQIMPPASRAIDLARRAVPLAPLSQSGSKLGMGAVPAPDAVYSEAFARAWASEDLVEGQRAFGERRTPSFEGR